MLMFYYLIVLINVSSPLHCLSLVVCVVSLSVSTVWCRVAGPSPGRHTYHTHIVVVCINMLLVLCLCVVCCCVCVLLLLLLCLFVVFLLAGWLGQAA